MTPEEIRKQMMGSAGIASDKRQKQAQDSAETTQQIAQKPFYVVRKGQSFGPHDIKELEAFVSKRDFAPEDVCWQEGWKEWRPIASILSTDAMQAKA